MAGHEIDQDHVAAGVFHHLATDHLVTSVIGAFDQYRGPYPLDQFKWRVLVKDDDEIDGFECRQYFRASLSRINRASFALESRGGRVAVEANHEPVASSSRFSQQLDVPAMQEIEAAIGKADAQAMAAPFAQPFVEHSPVEHDLVLGRERGGGQDAVAQL